MRKGCAKDVVHHRLPCGHRDHCLVKIASYVWKRHWLSLFLACVVNQQKGVSGWKFPFRRGRNSNQSSIKEALQQCDISVDPFASSPPPSLESLSLQTTKVATSNLDSLLSKTPTSTFPHSVTVVLRRINAILLYKPPVGLVTVLVVFRLLRSRRIFRIKPSDDENGADHEHQSRYTKRAMRRQRRRMQRTKQIHRGRALDLDAEDRSYQAYGGVERVRRRLALTALLNASSSEEEEMSADNGSTRRRCPTKALVEATVKSLQVTCPPAGALSNFVQSLLGPLSSAEFCLWEQPKVTDVVNNADEPAVSTNTTELYSLVRMAVKTAEIRALDALLRVSRDRLLRTSYRLRQTEQHWKGRVKLVQATGPFLQRVLRDSIEEDRIRLSYARAAYVAELSRLGRIQKVLMERPPELNDSNLLKALQLSATKTESTPNPTDLYSNSSKTQRWILSQIAKYSVRYDPEGKGQLTLKVYDSDANMDGQAAREVLLSSRGAGALDEWTQTVHEWTKNARKVICEVVKECLEGSVLTGDQELRRYREVEKHWCVYNYRHDARNPDESYGASPDQIRMQWDDLLVLVDNLKKFRRHGEDKLIGDAIVSRLNRLDILSLPSSLVAIVGAQLVHNFLAPRWHNLQQLVQHAVTAVSTFFEQRFWNPFAGIAQDVLSLKQDSMLDMFDLPNEEVSLDNMLRDLGFGDGSVESRKEAIHRATRQYEEDLRSGLIGNLFKGRLVRLLLMQIQQLKTGLLHAIANIDTLLQANRLNVQLLAAIPAILIITMGTRLFMRSLYHFRSMDLRPLSMVHGEMFETLDDMESILLLADRSQLVQVDDPTRSNAPATQVLGNTELGEFILNMHSYLVLLDFTCPPFPSRHCDSIHRLMQDMLGSTGSVHRLDIERQVVVLKLIKTKHKDLLRHV